MKNRTRFNLFTLIELLVAEPDGVRRPKFKPKTKTRAGSNRFTLIELLVVVSIIAILVAMLMPALVGVRHRAKMVTCLSNLKQVGMTATLYASENNNRYPYRTVFSDNTSTGRKSNAAWGVPWAIRSSWAPATLNDFTLFEELGISGIECPFTAPIEWDTDVNGAASNAWMQSSYSYYFGWKGGDDPGCGLSRATKPMVWKGKTFDILASDKIHGYKSTGALSAHPTTTGGDKFRDKQLNSVTYVSDYGNPAPRGPINSNFVRVDGSAFTLKGIIIFGSSSDSLTSRLPLRATDGDRTSYSVGFNLLPAVEDSN